jgi:Spy/CpxP family protein refolding chaperone
MKQRGWLILGCATLLSAALLQPALAHDRGYDDDYAYGRPMMAPPGGYRYGPAYGWGYGYGYGDRHHGPGMRHGGGRLDLSDEQRRAIHGIMRDARGDFRQLEDKIRDKRYDLYDVIDAGKDSNKIATLADDIGDLMAERIKLRAAVRIKILNELTPEQRDEARDIPFLDR